MTSFYSSLFYLENAITNVKRARSCNYKLPTQYRLLDHLSSLSLSMLNRFTMTRFCVVSSCSYLHGSSVTSEIVRFIDIRMNMVLIWKKYKNDALENSSFLFCVFHDIYLKGESKLIAEHFLYALLNEKRICQLEQSDLMLSHNSKCPFFKIGLTSFESSSLDLVELTSV